MKSKLVSKELRKKWEDDDGRTREKFDTTRREMKKALIERDDEIDVVLTALICQEHPLLVGPPGTAKSLLLDTLMGWMKDGARFSVLFNKYTTPEEVFGPISVMGLKNDVYRRITLGKLPEALFAFGDEIFKASTAILNTLLRILNERVYENGEGDFDKVPLLMFIGASNEWPNDQDGGKELGALFDRFLFRKKVRPISSKAGRSRLLWKDCIPKLSTLISPGEIRYATSFAADLTWDEDAAEALEEMLDTLMREGIAPGDRRQKKSVKAAQAYAWLCGAESVKKEHLEILAHTLWDDPTEQPEKCAKIVAKIANPIGAAITDKLLQVQDVLSKCSPTEAVPKLKAIQAELLALPSGSSAANKRQEAIDYVTSEIKAQYDRVIGA